MKPSDTISVLMCVHSTGLENDQLLARAFKSLYDQSYQNFEIVIVLDECWGGTERVIKEYFYEYTCDGTRLCKNVKVKIKSKKSGLAAAKNFGLKYCTGDWIAYLDADDEWMPCKLEVQRNWMLQNPEYDFVFTEAWDRHSDDILRPNCFEIGQYRTHEQIDDRLPYENCLCHGSAMIRKSALDALGGYDTSKTWLGQEDWEMWRRAVAAGYRFFKVPERVYIYSLNTGVAR